MNRQPALPRQWAAGGECETAHELLNHCMRRFMHISRCGERWKPRRYAGSNIIAIRRTARGAGFSASMWDLRARPILGRKPQGPNGEEERACACLAPRPSSQSHQQKTKKKAVQLLLSVTHLCHSRRMKTSAEKKLRVLRCVVCGYSLEGKRSHSLTCGDRCRQRKRRRDMHLRGW